MPAVDDARRRLLLAPRHVRALVHLAGQASDELVEAEEPGALGELRDAGLLLADGTAAPLVRDLLECMAVPVLRLIVEVLGPQGPTVADVVVSGQDVWLVEKWPGADPAAEVVHVRSELPTLMWDLTRLVGLRRITPPPDVGPVTADLLTVERLLATLGSDPQPGWDDVKAYALSRAGQDLAHLPPEDRTRWIAVMASLQASWRVTAFWGDPDTEHDVVRGLAVLDCGVEGYWRRVAPEEPLRAEDLHPQTPVRYEPLTGGQVWTAVARTLPTAAELRAAAATRATVR